MSNKSHSDDKKNRSLRGDKNRRDAGNQQNTDDDGQLSRPSGFQVFKRRLGEMVGIGKSKTQMDKDLLSKVERAKAYNYVVECLVKVFTALLSFYHA